jgi:hypothetical protein
VTDFSSLGIDNESFTLGCAINGAKEISKANKKTESNKVFFILFILAI